MSATITKETPVIEKIEIKEQRPALNEPPMPDRKSYRTTTDEDRMAWKDYLLALAKKNKSLEDPGIAMFAESDVWTISKVLRNPHLAHTLMSIPSVKEVARERILQILGGWAGSIHFALQFMERCRLWEDIAQDPIARNAARNAVNNAVKRRLFLSKKEERSGEDEQEGRKLAIDIKRASRIFKLEDEAPR